MTTDHNRQAHEYAFHAFRSQPNPWDGCNLTGGKSKAVAKPENRALFLLVLTGRHLFQDFFDLMELKMLSYLIESLAAASFFRRSGSVR
jgi:hypothetical protein